MKSYRWKQLLERQDSQSAPFLAEESYICCSAVTLLRGTGRWRLYTWHCLHPGQGTWDRTTSSESLPNPKPCLALRCSASEAFHNPLPTGQKTSTAQTYLLRRRLFHVWFFRQKNVHEINYIPIVPHQIKYTAGRWLQPRPMLPLESCSVLCCFLGDRVWDNSTFRELNAVAFKLLKTSLLLLTPSVGI